MLIWALALQGVLVTYQGEGEAGRERYTDDGRTLKSDIEFAGQKLHLEIARSPHRVRMEAAGRKLERDLPVGTIVLESGCWQCLALAAESYPMATHPAVVPVYYPSKDMTVNGMLEVSQDHGERHLELSVQSSKLIANIALGGAVTRASGSAPKLEARPEGEPAPPPPPPSRPLPDGVKQEMVMVERGGVMLRGVLWEPAKSHHKLPLVLIIASSGPTDLDGNNRFGQRTDLYRLLAGELAKRGVATLRYDKRGVGMSRAKVDNSRTVIDDLVEDAAAFVATARKNRRFSLVTVAGHSEGALVALLLGRKVRVDALILLAAPGRPLYAVLHDQLASQLDAAKLGEADRVLDNLRAGRATGRIPPELILFRPEVQALLKSELEIDPLPLMRSVKAPVVIVQGQMDAQTTVEDARRLAKARPDAKLWLLAKANHVFKEEADLKLPQRSYTDPSRPVVPGLIDAVVAEVKR